MKIMSVNCRISRRPWRTGPTTIQSHLASTVRIAGLKRKIASSQTLKESTMAWTKPEFTDLRFGFEVTMYIANR
jgi:coenzyme PQQ precursor peptide PqqA